MKPTFLISYKAMVQSSDFREKNDKQIKTNIKETTLKTLLNAVYCQDVDPFSFHAACDLLQVALYYKFDHVIKITVKFLVRCARHRMVSAKRYLIGSKYQRKPIGDVLMHVVSLKKTMYISKLHLGDSKVKI